MKEALKELRQACVRIVRGPHTGLSEGGQPAAPREARFLCALALAALSIKLIFVLIDPHMRLFMGDSATYLASAVHWWAPPDRSFTYPLLISITAGATESIGVLLLLQTVLGIGTALLACWILRRFFQVRRSLAAAAALALVLDPGQLFYERMVMTESTSTFVLMATLATALAYLRNGDLRQLLACIALGILLSSLRAALAPVALLLPAVAVLLRLPNGPGTRRHWLVHLAVAVVATWSGHEVYKHWYAWRAGGEPGYILDSGIFRLGLVAPLVKPAHFAGAGVDPALLDEVTIPLSDPHNREAQIWLPGGLIDVLKRHAGERTRHIAGLVANRAIADDPWGMLRLGLNTELDYFNRWHRHERLWSDLGSGQLPDAHTIELLRRHFRYDATGIARTPSFIWSYFSFAAIWLVVCHFLLAPLAGLMLALCWWTQRRCAALFALLSVGFVVGNAICSHIISYRYLHPFSVLVIVCAAVIVEVALLAYKSSRIAALRQSAHNWEPLQPLPSP
jgi:hypothetical protein